MRRGGRKGAGKARRKGAVFRGAVCRGPLIKLIGKIIPQPQSFAVEEEEEKLILASQVSKC